MSSGRHTSRRSGIFAAAVPGGRSSTSGGVGGGARKWGRLGDEEEDAFNIPNSTNVSMLDLNGQDSPELEKNRYLGNPYTASGESIAWQPQPPEKGERVNNEDEEDGQYLAPTLGKHDRPST